MRSRRVTGFPGRSCGWLTVGLLVLGATAVVVPPAAAAEVYCAPLVDVIVWDGSSDDPPGAIGDNRNWDDAENWDTDCVPGAFVQPPGEGYDDDVTIPAGASVFLEDGESAHIEALHNAGALTLSAGARLLTFGDSESHTLTLKGLLGGTDRFTVTSRLNWVSTTDGAATQTTRACTSVCGTPLPPGGEGTTVIAPGAQLTISGRGVNLQDRRIIENHGTTTLSGNGYVAADYGTRFRNLRLTGDPVPQFAIRNDGGYYQGIPQFDDGLSEFTNSGRVVKSAGTGLSVIDAAFSSTDPGSSSTGTVEVRAGTLSILGQDADESRTAKVKQGLSFGNGGCADGQPPCTVLQPTSDDPQLATVELTLVGTALPTVAITELSTAPVAGQRGVPVEIHAPQAQATVSAPLRSRILLDDALVDPDETAAEVAQTSPVFRQGTTGPFVKLPNCGPSGNPTQAKPTCVARGLSVAETAALGNGDVVLVISSLTNSRYRVGGR